MNQLNSLELTARPLLESTELREDTETSRLSADFYVNSGDRFWHESKLPEAVEAYRRAIELETTSPRVYYRIAEALKQLGNDEEAAFYYRLAVNVNNNSRSIETEPLKITDMAGEIESNSLGEAAGFDLTPQQQTAQIYLEQANSYLEEGKWEATIFACQKILQILPNSVEAYRIWGNALQRQGKISEAMGYYARALTIKPDSPEIYANLGTICAQKQKWQEALEYYQKAIELKPDFAGAYRNLAKVWKQLGDTDRAKEAADKAEQIESSQNNQSKLLAGRDPEEIIEYYRQALRQKPDSLELYRALADILEQLKRWQDAAACYRKIAELERLEIDRSIQPALPNQANSNNSAVTPNPQVYSEANSIEVYLQAGNALVQQQEWQKALAAYDRALKIEPDRPDIYRQIAKITAKIGQKEAAARYWTRALDIEGKQASPTEYMQLGNLWRELNSKEEAVNCYRRALQLQPTLNEAYHHFGTILADAGNLGELVELYKLAITYNPDYLEHYYHLAEICRHRGDWAAVAACYQKSLAIAPDNWEIFHSLGDACLKQEKYDEACQAYRRAIVLNPNSFWSCHNLGYTLLKQENFSEAIVFLQQAIALDNNFFWTYYNLGNVCIQLEKWQQAATAFTRVLELQSGFSPAKQKLEYVRQRENNDELDLAFKLYLEAIQRNPQDIESYKKALEIHPDRLHLQLELARILRQNDRIEEAIASLQQALALDPQNTEIYRDLSELMRQKRGN